MTGPRRDLRALPKAHLHVHVTGSIRSATYRELAARAGVEPIAFPRAYDWPGFLAAYRAAKTVLRTPEDLHRVVVELVEDSAADGAVWTEVGVSPSGTHRALTGSDDATLDLVTDAVTAAGGAGGIVVGADRERDAADPEAVATLAARWAGRGVVGLGLAGDERAPCTPFRRAAEIARAAGLLVVPHSGELCGPDSIREVLRVLRPDRLMHGVRAADDPGLLAELADHGITCDVCPTSNLALGVVARPAGHPLPAMLRAGVPCSLNADDTLLFSTGLLPEYERARTVLGLPDDDLARVARASVRASGAPPSVIGSAEAGIDAWLAAP